VLAGLTEFDATFPAREARAFALEQSAGAPIEAALEQLRELRASDEILVLADGAGTTRRHRGRERTLVAIAGRLADAQIPALPAGVAEREVERLDRALAADRGRLSDEQRSAIHLACGPRPLVVIEGQAGTGKSTTLTAIARAHQASGQRIIVTSTAALAAQRLAGELGEQGVRCRAYSTAALDAAVAQDRLALSPATTIVHDEAALASTREQLTVLDAVESSGVRLIMVGDAQQNQPVGAGGLWADIQDATRTAEARAELTLNVRAQDAGERRDQALFRHGWAEVAVRGYAAGGRVHFDEDPRRLEDRALDAAHADRTAGKTTILIAQTSNDKLDALNARAQAIRHQAGQLGEQSLPVPGRPYRLRAGDHVQIRRTIWHDDFGPLRNGTPARITGVDRDGKALSLSLARGDAVTLTAEQTADADLRLAYAQHPFPAQGRTTDTTHLIVGEHATREGSYVGLTRARARTDVYAVEAADVAPARDRLGDLAERMSRTEPDMPSIRTALAHEAAITAGTTRGVVAEPDRGAVLQPGPDPSDDLDLDRNERSARSWPGTRSEEPLTLADEAERERERSLGLEP
jgi:ATP-dependent exoDNAse (exonuclease V) alpha subunit